MVTKTDDLRQFIQEALVESPGELNKELIELCRGLVAIEPEGRSVRILSNKMTEKEQVALLCLGYWILSYFLDSPSLSNVSREQLVKALGTDGKAVSAYSSLLKRERLLETNSRGSYHVVLARMPDFLRGLHRKLDTTRKVKEV